MDVSRVIEYVKKDTLGIVLDVVVVMGGIYTLGFSGFVAVSVGLCGWLWFRWKDKLVERIKGKGATNDQLVENSTGHIEERAEWLNECVEQLWPFIQEIVRDIMKDEIEPAIQKQLAGVSFDVFDLLEHFHFKEVDLGNQPVRLGGIRMCNDMKDPSKVILDAELVYAGDAHVEAGLRVLSFGIKDIQVRGTIRIELNPVLPKPPLIGGITVYFLESPSISFNLTKALNIGDIPGLHNLIKGAVSSVIDSFIVLPEKYTLMFGKEMPSGVLRGKVVSASDLEAKDHNVFKKDSSDPFVKVKVGEFRHETKVIENSLSPKWEDENFILFIEKLSGQKIQFKVKDQDDVGKNDLLGKAEVDLEKICLASETTQHQQDLRTTDYVLPLEDGKGWLNCQLEWLYFTEDVTEIKKQISAGSTICVFIKLENASGLPAVEKADGVHVRITVGDTTITSLTKKNSTRPVWNEMHYFFVHNSQVDSAAFQVKDKDNNDLGHFKLPISSLFLHDEMKMSKAFPLEDCPTDGLLRATVELKGLATSKPTEK